MADATDAASAPDASGPRGSAPKAPAQVVQAALVAQNFTTGYDGAKIIEGLDIAVPQGKVSVIIGGNGCGKSTLLKTLARLIKLQGGAVLLDGRDIYRLPTKKLAQQLGLLPQTSVAPEGIRVCDLVARGRYPYQTLFSGMGHADYEAVCEALDLMGIAELAERTVDELSGGQRQRVWIAMALAQQTDVLLLDEPTTYLDVAYQIEILDLMRDLNRRRGTTVVMVLHDINLSSRYADHMFALAKGEHVTQGTPREVVTVDTMRRVFDLDCEIIDDPVSGTPLIVPRGKCVP